MGNPEEAASSESSKKHGLESRKVRAHSRASYAFSSVGN